MFPRLLLLFIVVPFVELVLLLKVGSKIGIVPTLAIIVVTAIIGASLTKMQGAATMAKAQRALNEGRMPHSEVMDGLMIIIAGAVLLTPGFLTDAFGFSLLVPGVRSMVRKRLAAAFKSRVQVVGSGGVQPRPSADQFDDDNVIEAEVVDVEK
jgi:UPF0716 protein FxsA